jgi:hypothetical protein
MIAAFVTPVILAASDFLPWFDYATVHERAINVA